MSVISLTNSLEHYHSLNILRLTYWEVDHQVSLNTDFTEVIF